MTTAQIRPGDIYRDRTGKYTMEVLAVSDSGIVTYRGLYDTYEVSLARFETFLSDGEDQWKLETRS